MRRSTTRDGAPARGGVVGTTIRILQRSKTDGLTDASAALAFWAFLSLLPAVVAFVAVLGSLSTFIGPTRAEKVRNEILVRVDNALAGGTLESLRNTVRDILENPRGGLAIVGLAGAVYTMSKGFAGLLRALARIHGHPEAAMRFRVRIDAVVLGLGTVGVLTVVTLQLVLGPAFGYGAELSGAGSLVYTLWGWLRYPFLAAAALWWMTVLQKAGSGEHRRLRAFLPGAALALVLLVAVGVGTWLVVQLGLLQANPVFGVLGSVIIVLTVLNLLARTILMGGQLNAIRFEDAARAAAAPVAVLPPATASQNGTRATGPAASAGARVGALALLAGALLGRRG